LLVIGEAGGEEIIAEDKSGAGAEAGLGTTDDFETKEYPVDEAFYALEHGHFRADWSRPLTQNFPRVLCEGYPADFSLESQFHVNGEHWSVGCSVLRLDPLNTII